MRRWLLRLVGRDPDPVILPFVRPPHTPESVGLRLVRGLRDGSLTLGPAPEPDPAWERSYCSRCDLDAACVLAAALRSAGYAVLPPPAARPGFDPADVYGLYV